MKRFSPIPLFAVLAAGAIGACSDGTAPATASRSDARASQSANSAEDLSDASGITTIDVPGATATVAFGINNQGVVVGRYASAGRTHGFARSAEGELTTIDFPGASLTVAAAVNSRGDIVGWYNLTASPTVRHGFLLRDGMFTTVDPPGSNSTGALGINDRGDIVGRFCDRPVCRDLGNGDYRGFLLRDDVFTTVDVPGSAETHAWDINDRGEFLGAFQTAGGEVDLFLIGRGNLTTFSLPNGKPVSNDNGGINARGDIVGKYCDVSPCLAGRPSAGHGFVLSDGRLTTIDVPGALGTAAFGINARREVVGGYFDAGGALHGYVTRVK